MVTRSSRLNFIRSLQNSKVTFLAKGYPGQKARGWLKLAE
jgi:hypothetical protein